MAAVCRKIRQQPIIRTLGKRTLGLVSRGGKTFPMAVSQSCGVEIFDRSWPASVLPCFHHIWNRRISPAISSAAVSSAKCPPSTMWISAFGTS
jgi:hypothetical protein